MARWCRIAVTGFLVSACATMEGVEERYLVCSYNQVWDAALATVNDRPVTVKDKDKGLIETDWLEVPAPGRKYGVLRREIADARDRSRLVLNVTRVDSTTKLVVTETRESWKFRGGSRLFGWQPAEPSEEEMEALMRRFTTKLKEQGCTPT